MGVLVMDKMETLFAAKPFESGKPCRFQMILAMQVYMDANRREKRYQGSAKYVGWRNGVNHQNERRERQDTLSRSFALC